MSAIPDRVWELLTPEETENLRLVMAGWRHEPRINCPQCGVQIGIRLRIEAQPRISADVLTPPKPPEARVGEWEEEADLTYTERAVLAEAEATGLLAAFQQAVEEEKAGMVPQNMKKFLLLFLRNARLDVVPRFVLNLYKDDFAPARLDFYSSQGIIAVTADGVTKAFFPKSRLVGRRLTQRVPGQMKAVFQSDERVEEWIRGRFGYVPREAKAFTAAMRQDNLGKFGRLVQ